MGTIFRPMGKFGKLRLKPSRIRLNLSNQGAAGARQKRLPADTPDDMGNKVDKMSQPTMSHRALLAPSTPSSEEALQAQWAAFLDANGLVHHHSPNEGRRGWRAQRALKSSGCAAGWPDSEIVWDGRIFFLELKMPGRKPTKIQAARHEELRRAGAKVAVGTNLSELAAALVEWGIPLRIGLAEFARLRTAGRMTAAQYRAMRATAPEPTEAPKLVLKRKPLAKRLATPLAKKRR